MLGTVASCVWANDHMGPNSYEDLSNMNIIIGSNLTAERAAMRFYRQMALLVGHRDETTRRVIDDMLRDAEKHVTALTAWMKK